MNNGKQICRALKKLRKRIADANGIPFEIEECPFEGPCRGTCPKCEQELRLLEEALRRRELDGEDLVLEDLMSDEELRLALDERPLCPDDDELDDFDIRTPGIPARDDYEGLMGDAEIPPEQGILRYINSNTLIANKLMKHLFDAVDGENMMFSPLGVASILTMLRRGTKDKSLISQHIDSLLDGFRIEDFFDRYYSDITLEHASSMWYNRQLGQIKESYVAEIQHLFGTEPQAVDFACADAAKAQIDRWVSKHTHGMIKKLDMQISDDALMLLVDALYMKADWDEPFDVEETSHRNFYNVDGTASRVAMMRRYIPDAEYDCNADYQVIKLCYKDCDVFMNIVLPHEGKDLATVMRHRDWLEVESDCDCDVDLQLPRFKFDCKVELEDTLSALGLGDLFHTETSLPEITDLPAHVSRIFQQCAVSVAEKGTEAAAVTVADVEVGCAPPEEEPECRYMTVNRPFGFAIQDSNDVVLFVGVVNHLDDIAPAEPPRQGKYITSFTVAGTTHIENIEDLAGEITVGTELTLRRDATNRYDSNAIGVYLGEERVGFVPREKNQVIANLLDAGLDLFALVTDASWHHDWFTIQANILLPTSK